MWTLNCYKCPPQVTKLIMNLHRNRALHFKIDGHVGEALTPERGVAQGSPLSCILFVMCMQLLLNRLKVQTDGIWGKEDDAAFVDDLTLLARDATKLETKWAIVRSFEQWTDMRVNIGKCEYDTTEEDPTKWAHIPGALYLRKDSQDNDAVRILGFWTTITGQRDTQLHRIINSIRMTAIQMKKKLISPAIAKGILNMIMSSRLNYTAQLNEIPAKYADAIAKEVESLARAQFGLSGPTIKHRMYTPDNRGGLGLEDPTNVATRAALSEYIIAINSDKEAYTAAILKANAEKVQYLSRHAQHIPRRTGAAVHTPQCRTWLRLGHECHCGNKAYQDTQHAQVMRCAKRLGLRLEAAIDANNNILHTSEERERRRLNGKQPIEQGELVWMQNKSSGEERLAAFHGAHIEGLEHGQIALAWLPSINTARKVKHNTILSRPTDAVARGIPVERAYMEAGEVARLYEYNKGQRADILARIQDQWQAPRKLTRLKQIPGILTYWVEKWDDWHIPRVRTTQQEITQRWRAKGKLRKKTFQLRILEEILEDISMEPNQAYLDKQKVKDILKSNPPRAITGMVGWRTETSGHHSPHRVGSACRDWRQNLRPGLESLWHTWCDGS